MGALKLTPLMDVMMHVIVQAGGRLSVEDFCLRVCRLSKDPRGIEDDPESVERTVREFGFEPGDDIYITELGEQQMKNYERDF